MKKLLFLSAIFFVLLSSKCEDDNPPEPTDTDTATLELNFKSVFSGDPLLMYASDYPYEDNMAVRFQLFQFYISEVELLSEGYTDTGGEMVLDVDLVSFKDIQSVVAAEEGVTVSIPNLGADKSYTGIRFKIGVAPNLNSTTPGDYSVDHPLSNHYWSASMGYVFSKIEGNADLDGSGSFSEKLTFHTGTDTFLRDVIFSTSFDLLEGETTNIEFEVDLQKVLVRDNGEFMDFRVTSADHTSNPDVAGFIADNFPNAIQIKE